MGRGISLLFHDRGTRRGWVASRTPRAHFTPGKDSVSIVHEAGWAPGPVWKGGKSRPHRDSIPDRPARSQSLHRLSYPKTYIHKLIIVFNPWITWQVFDCSSFPTLQQSTVGQDLFFIEASRSHKDTPQSVGFLWTSDQPDAETSTLQHTTLTRHRHSTSQRGFKPAIETSVWPQTDALGLAATGIGNMFSNTQKISIFRPLKTDYCVFYKEVQLVPRSKHSLSHL